MRISILPRGIVDTARTKPGLTDLKNAGFENVALDIMSFSSPGEMDSLAKKSYRREDRIYLSEKPSEVTNVVRRYCEHAAELGLGMPVAFGTRQEFESKRSDLNETLYELSLETIKLAEKQGSDHAVIYPLLKGFDRADFWKVNKEYYGRLARETTGSKVKILLINIPWSVNGHLCRGFFSEAADIKECLSELNKEAGSERFGFCLDIGYMSLQAQEPYELITALGDMIDAVIVRDTDGQRDLEILPFVTSTGGPENAQTNWLSIFRGLRQTGYDKELILAVGMSACCVSTMYKPSFLSFAYRTIDYIRWQINMENAVRRSKKRVLFGAGNMCRNYMKNYGKDYPPLFTCDNNTGRWGEEFCGLTVRSPEELKNLDEDCVIFICNIYYREIEAQLREMGIKNRIEYFNDEYMPTFHEQRIDMAIEK